jgi:hypothetical protein
MFNQNFNITILNQDWKVIKQNVKLKCVPGKNELVFLEDLNQYFDIVNVIHRINAKHEILLVVKEFSK